MILDGQLQSGSEVVSDENQPAVPGATMIIVPGLPGGSSLDSEEPLVTAVADTWQNVVTEQTALFSPGILDLLQTPPVTVPAVHPGVDGTL